MKPHLQNRQLFVGASEVPALFGMDPFRTKQDVWKSKIDPEEEKFPKPRTAMWYGNHLEWSICEMAMEVLECIREPLDTHGNLAQKQFIHKDGVLRATCDLVLPHYKKMGKIKEKQLIVEIKTTGFAGVPIDHDWGRAGTDQVPERAMMQCQAQMEASGIENLCVALFNGHNSKGLQLYFVDRSKPIGRAIVKEVNEFWSSYVLPKISPGVQNETA